MALFLKFNNIDYSYEELLKQVSSREEYIPCLKTANLMEYFSNLILGIANNLPLTLLDSDISVNEIPSLPESSINERKKIQGKDFESLEDLVSAMIGSRSEISIFTSGTTGQPKKIEHSIRTLTRNTRTSESHKGDIWGFAYNPTHMAGLQVFFQALFNLNPIINLFGESRESIYNLIASCSITHISATPTFYRLLLPEEYECRSVRRISFGGEKSDKVLYDKISHIFPDAKINNLYASTEAGTLFAAKGDCFQIPESLISKIKIEDDELLIHCSLLGKSESLMLDGEFFHSGDLIEWVDEGSRLFKFRSRKNEMINVGGYKVNPHEVEEALMKMPDVKIAVAYARDNSVLGNILCADIVPMDGYALNTVDIKKRLKEQIQDFKVPRIIKIVQSLDTTRTGKIKR